MFFKIRSRTYTVPDKFWNGQKLNTHTRLSFTQDPRIRASFLKANFNSTAVCNRIYPGTRVNGVYFIKSASRSGIALQDYLGRSWFIKGTPKSHLEKDSLVLLTHHKESDFNPDPGRRTHPKLSQQNE